MKRFDRKVALPTGAARGLGRVTAQAFAREGAKVVVADIDDAGGQETMSLVSDEGAEVLFIRADVGTESDVAAPSEKTVDAYGRLDCAVNNAGVVRFNPLVQSAAGFDFHLHTNLRGVFIA
jgi:NAD(P)-dependent dehydrogenase (short-subunit alcohol dehydrogenase family)